MLITIVAYTRRCNLLDVPLRKALLIHLTQATGPLLLKMTACISRTFFCSFPSALSGGKRRHAGPYNSAVLVHHVYVASRLRLTNILKVGSETIHHNRTRIPSSPCHQPALSFGGEHFRGFSHSKCLPPSAARLCSSLSFFFSHALLMQKFRRKQNVEERSRRK